MAEIEGVHLRITGDSSQAVREFKKLKDAAQSMKDWQPGGWKFDMNKALEGIDRVPKVWKNTIKISLQEALEQGFSGLDTVGKRIEGIFGGLLTTITAGITGVTGAFAKIAKDSLAIGGSFEAAMTSVKVISGATAEELDLLTKKAREMGATLPISATDSANAMTVMVQRGTSARDTLASVSEIASFAISQGVDMATAADLVGSTLKNFGLTVEDTARVANEFNIASNSSALNISKLVEAMKYVAPAAASVGASLEEALAAQESLADSGLTGEMIGTGLAMVYSKLATKTRIMGVETKNLDGTLRPLKEIFTELQQKGFSLAEATTVFGQRGAKAALNLAKFSSSLEQQEENLKKLGVTQAAVEEKMKSWPNVWNAFRSAMEELHIEIFEQIKEQSKDAVSGVATLTRTFSDWIGKTKLAEKSLNAFLGGLGLKIPSGDDFKKLLEKFNVDAFVKQMRNFGSTVKTIADSIANFYNLVKTPLQFLIKHLDTFAAISFWGWILGRGLQIPLAILNIANAFTQLRTQLSALLALNLGHILTFFTNLAANPIVAGTIAAGGIGLGLHAIYKSITEWDKGIERANTQLEKTKLLKEKLEREINEANQNVETDIKINLKTGFEVLPDEYNKISSELRDKLDRNIETLQAEFKTKIANAFNEITSATLTGKNITDTVAEKITRALQGSLEAFNELNPIKQKVVAKLVDMGVEAGRTTGEIEELKKVISEVKVKDSGKSIFADFAENLTLNIDEVLDEFPASIERMKEFIGEQDLELILNVQLEQAKKSLEAFTKSASEKYAIPEEIINRGIFNRLQELATQGNATAQKLVYSFGDVDKTVDEFIQSSRDAIEYLGASPETFTPALEKLTSNIQKINPLTGKVTEQFKKAYAALKEWANITFDKLAQRIQKLRKAFEGGFISKEALEAEYRKVTPQIKAQVIAELQPMKDQLSSSNYYSILASEFTSRLQDIGGDVFIEMWRKEVNNLWSQSGQVIGAAIERQAKNVIASNTTSQPVLTPQNFSQALTPLINKVEQIGNQRQGNTDYSGSISLIVTEIKNISTNIQNVRTAIAALEATLKALQIPTFDSSGVISGIQDIRGAINTLDNTVKSQSQTSIDTSEIISAIQNVVSALQTITGGNTYDIDIHQQGFVVQEKSDADMLARYTMSALRSGIGNGGI